ncbi:ABC transporter substrate-binding protein [Corynebacterium callunae]|uniref:ABC transporter substrate-binding protein n=1 Tax=Corynebacterium callunae TaxID=1721 RepID=UPI0039828944
MKNSKRISILATSVLVAALTLSGCSSASSDTSSTSSSANSSSGGTLTFAIGNDPLVFNPSGIGNGNDTLYVTRQIFDSLVYSNPDTAELEPWLAKSWEVNADATQFTFHLRDDVTFSDGSALTAQTVAANFDDIKAAGANSSGASDIRTYESSQVVDDHTVIIKLSAPNAAFLSALAGVPFGIVSDASLKIPFADRALGKGVAGSGPFTLESYTKDSQVTLKKREGYKWAPADFENRGDAYLDSVEFKIIPEAGNRTGGLSSGQIDVAGGIAPNDIASVEASNSIVSRANPGTIFGLYFNYKKSALQDEKVREAVSLAVDPQEVRDGALSDQFKVATSPLSSTTKDYADVSDAIKTNDPEAAKKLLDEAGWVVGPDGTRTKDGQTLNLRITYINNFGANADSIALIQEQLRAVGIASTQVTGTVPEFLSTITAGDYDLAWANSSKVDADVLRSTFGDVGSTTNFPIADPELQAELGAQQSIGDPAARSAALEKIQHDIVARYEFVPVHELTTVIGVADDIEGVSLGADSRLSLLVDAKETK